MDEPSRAQTWSAQSYAENGRFVADMAGAAFDWLAPREGEDILDLGCGDGALTQKIAQAGAKVVGADSSAPLLVAAKALGLDVREMDGQALTFDREFDAVFTNATLHWMSKSKDVIAGVARALRPGGRFVGEFGGHGNVAAIITAMRAVGKDHGADVSLAGPWFYPTPDEYAALLEEGGFVVGRIGLFPRPTPLPTGMAGWLMTFRKPFFDQFDELERIQVAGEVVDLLQPSLCDTHDNWTADYMRLRFEAHLAA